MAGLLGETQKDRLNVVQGVSWEPHYRGRSSSAGIVQLETGG